MKNRNVGSGFSRMVLLLLITVGSVMPVMSQETTGGEAGEMMVWHLGAAVNGGFGSGDAMGGLSGEISRSFGPHFEAGFRFSAESKVGTDYQDGAGQGYHMASTTATLMLKPKFRPFPWLELALPIESGNGFLQYRYDGEYRETMLWDEEILDQVSHSFYSAGVEGKLMLPRGGAISLAGGYRLTGPLRTPFAADDELSGPWMRLGYSLSFPGLR